MITLNPLELLLIVTQMTVCQLITKKTGWQGVCSRIFQLISNSMIEKIFIEILTVFLIYIFINP
jgi:hypothetical protein